ncbi:MAG: TonB-dependent receptor plug domain-containing protein, partial [Gammaproteobacteria bacterium]|nr:TonB-dependent receptor plug domain-containing protein [Gammaproteobacteria bacterium]
MTGVALAVQLANVPTVSAAAEEMVISEIIVTAQLREQNVQDVPLSVSAISSDSLRDGGVIDISRLKLLVPGMNFGQTGAYAHVAIRGARTEAIQVNTQPIISNYIDGIYRAGTEQFLGPMVDVNRVEVLRGPQGT